MKIKLIMISVIAIATGMITLSGCSSSSTTTVSSEKDTVKEDVQENNEEDSKEAVEENAEEEAADQTQSEESEGLIQDVMFVTDELYTLQYDPLLFTGFEDNNTGDYTITYENKHLEIPGTNTITISVLKNTDAKSTAQENLNKVFNEERTLDDPIQLGEGAADAYLFSHSQEGEGEVFANVTTWYYVPKDSDTILITVNRAYTNDGDVDNNITVDDQFAAVLDSFELR